MGENKPIITGTKIQTAISNYAFINREDITDIVIPNGIKSIGERAFEDCRNLTSIEI